jgi:ABC-type antimicrobial peptide transport system permease subunit
MHISLITKRVIDNIYNRKMNFIMTILVRIVTLYLLFLVIGLFLKSRYYIFETKKLFEFKDVLNVNIVVDFLDNGYCDAAAGFISDIKEKYIDEYEDFMYMNVDYSTSGVEVNKDTLFVDGIENNLHNINFEECINGDGFLKGFVSESELENYPLGTVLENEITSSKTKIVGYYSDDAVWPPSLLFHTSDTSVRLDKYIVVEMDEAYFEIDKSIYANMFNSIYVKANENDKKAIRDIADKNGIKCYVYTIDDLIQAEKDENSELMKSTGTLVLFVTLVAMLSVFTANMVDTLYRQREIAIMRLNGVTGKDIFMIMFVENALKLAISFGIAVFVYAGNLTGTERALFYNPELPAVIIGSLFFEIVITVMAYSATYRKSILDLMGGERL